MPNSVFIIIIIIIIITIIIIIIIIIIVIIIIICSWTSYRKEPFNPLYLQWTPMRTIFESGQLQQLTMTPLRRPKDFRLRELSL